MTYYRTTYLPAIGYSLPITSMTPHELQQIQTLMNSVVLNKLGYNRHYPRAVAFAPTQEFGTGLHDIRLEQGLAQIQALLNYIGTGHKVGRLMLISYRNLQIEAGVSFHLLEQPQTQLPYLTPCWLTSLRQFCSCHGITISVLQNKLPTASCIHDRFIMDIAITCQMKKQDLIDLNLVRIYLGVCKLSDITNATGDCIAESVWRCTSFSDRRSLLQYPRQAEPSTLQRRIWRTFLR